MKFGVREIVDVVFKATTNGQKIGDKTFKKYQPVFKIDTATTSSLEQATTTVYAQGGKGYARLIAWEGEKTMTFTVTDALMSPMGLAVLTGAGLITPNKTKQTHFHLALNGIVSDTAGTVEIDFDDIRNELGLADATSIDLCNTIDVFGTKLDGSGAGIGWFNACSIKDATQGAEYVTVDAEHPAKFTIADSDGTTTTPAAKGDTIQVDFYVIMNNSITEVHIEPESFGGYFYVEAATLYRREDTGKDMAAEIVIPKAKVQSAFTFTMAASGDPSTFDFVMDAMPGYTRFDPTTKKMCVIQVVGTDATGAEEAGHTHEDEDTNDSPDFHNGVGPTPGPTPEYFDTDVAAVPASAVSDADWKINQGKASVVHTVSDGADAITLTVAGGTDSLEDIEPVEGWGYDSWIALDYDTGEDSIVGISYINRGTTTVLGADDVANATALGLGAGHMVVWVKAGLAKTTPATFSLEKDGKSISVTITAVDGE